MAAKTSVEVLLYFFECTAVVPELPGCKSDGDTPAEALANALDAIECWIEAAEEMGRKVPRPKIVQAA